MPYRRRRVKNDHVVSMYRRGLTAMERADRIMEINRESLKAVVWGRMQVKQKMMLAMARVGLKVGNQNANKFTDIKDSLRDDTSNAKITRIYKLCYGDYEEGEEEKRWSSSLEDKYMQEMRLKYRTKPTSSTVYCLSF